MKSNYKKLAPYIRQIDERNADDIHYELLGVSVDKCFIKSIANTVGTDWRGYKKIRRGQFCYIPDTSRRGDKIGIALLCDSDIALVSQAYTVFEISDTTNLLPEYLNLWFKRPEFDRYARFHSHGSVREIFDWEEMGNVMLPIPSIEEQQKIVDAYNAIERRISIKRQINDNLQQQAQALYKDMFSAHTSDDWELGTLSDLAEIVMGQSPSGDSYNEEGNGMVFFQGRTEFGARFPTIRLYTTEPKRVAKENDVLMSVRAPVGDINIAHEECCIGRGLGALRSKTGDQSFLLYTLYSLQQQLQVFNGEGTVFGSINRDSLNGLQLKIPDKDTIKRFETIASPMDVAIRINHDENCRLASIRNALLPCLMSGEIDVSEVDI